MAGFDRGDRGDRGGRGGGRPSFRKGGFGGGSRPPLRGGDRDDRPKEMHDAVCNSCGKDCQVPFRPTGDKPVFCRECFSKQGGGRELGRQAGERGSKSQFDSRRDNTPSPVASGSANNQGMSEVKKQLEQVNTKLERLISVVNSLAELAKDTKVATPKVTKKAAPKKVTKKTASKK